MERKAAIMVVLGFVIATAIAFSVFTSWIKGPGNNGEGEEMHILFNGSVSGLSVGSEVRYLGVLVGRVKGISLSQEFSGNVDVYFLSEAPLPDPADLTAILEPQGITGLSIVQLNNRQGQPIPAYVPEDVIAGQPSILAQLSGSAGRILSGFESSVGRFNDLFDEQLTADIRVTFQQTRSLVNNFDRATTDLDQILTRIASVSQEMEMAFSDFRKVANQLDEDVLPLISSATESVSQASDVLSSSIEENRSAFSSVLTEDMPTLARVSEDLALTLREINRLLGNINDEPGALLYGEQINEVEIPIE